MAGSLIMASTLQQVGVVKRMQMVLYNEMDFTTTDANAAGPHGWGPPLEAASKERRSPGGPNYTESKNYSIY